jgi:hypothetical protein
MITNFCQKKDKCGVKTSNGFNPEIGQSEEEFLNTFPILKFEVERKNEILLTGKHYVLFESGFWRIAINEFAYYLFLRGWKL